MSLIGSDFVQHVCERTKRCSECGMKMSKGFTALASIRRGKVMKLVCSEKCRLEFDNNFWQQVAYERGRGGDK